MRKLDKIVVWPAYFDATRTRKNGRRIPKNLAVPYPKITEIEDAVKKIGLEHEVRAEVGYPRAPLSKTGMLLVKKTEAKERTILRIAKQLSKIRSETPTK
jgi:signal recognition particle subunit SRP19